MLTFEEETHTYRWNGRTVPSCTQIISYVGLTRHYHDEAAMALGTTVHKIIKDYELKNVTAEEIHPVFRGYLRAYQRFKSDMGYEPIVVEQPFYSELGFCGTPDGMGNSCIGAIVPDWKTGSIGWQTGVQLAGYERLIVENKVYSGRIKRMGVYLGADGTYDITMFHDRSDWSYFLSALSVVNAIINHNGKLE